jgi:hypothetical protein
MAKPTRRFVPRLEAFDDRCLPSVTMLIDGGTSVQVQCDDTADNILVREETGVLSIYDNGSLIFSRSGMSLVEVFTNGGNDTVTYQVAPGDLAHSQTLRVDLGAGNDTFNATMDNVTVDSGNDLIVQAFGRAGGDTFNVSAQNAHVSLNASLVVDLIAGKGKATFNVDYTGVTVDQDPNNPANDGLFSHSEGRK